MDAYHLEADIYTPTQASNEKEQLETVKVSLATACKYNLECLHYNARVIVRVCASNRAGKGPFSKDITIYTEKGKLDFTPATWPGDKRVNKNSRSSTPSLSSGRGNCAVLCSWANLYTVKVPLSAQEYQRGRGGGDF